MRTPTVITLFIVAGAAPSAIADADTADSVSDTVRVPLPNRVFGLMDNTGDDSQVDLELPVAAPSVLDGGPFGARLRAQYLVGHQAGGYVSMHATSTVDDLEIGNLELGALFHSALGTHTDLGARIATTLPTSTASRGSDMLVMPPADVAVALDGAWLRVGVSPTFHGDGLVLRADLGVDIQVAQSSEQQSMSTAASIGHLNVGAGVLRGRVSGACEVQTVFSSDTSRGLIGFTARYQGDRISPFLAISKLLIPRLDDKVMVTAGLTIPL